MAEPSTGDPSLARPGPLRSLASKFSLFTAALVFWVISTILAYDLRQDTFDVGKGLLLFVIVMLVAAAIARFTIRLLARPLSQLQAGIVSARNGRLEPITVSKTGDEVEFLGESFNGMIGALAASQKALLEQQGLLEKRIQERTDQLEEAMRTAQAASRAKSEFLANISHELRTPMNGVIGLLDIALDRELSPELAEQLQTAQRCAYSLLSLLNDILDLSKIEAGKMTLEKLPLDFRVLLADCIKAHQPKATGNSVSLHAEVSPDVPRQITGDPLRIRQIIANLVSNAVKFTEHGSVTVRAGGEFTQAGRVHASHHGPGQRNGNPSRQAALHFRQVHASRWQREPPVRRNGIGLGHHAKPRAVARRRHPGSERTGPGKYFHRDPQMPSRRYGRRCRKKPKLWSMFHPWPARPAARRGSWWWKTIR